MFKDVKFKDLSLAKKVIFFGSLSAIISVLTYTAINFDDFHNRIDVIKETNQCEYTFQNGVLIDLTCLSEIVVNQTLINNYTLVNYYDDRRPKRDYNFEIRTD